MSTLAYNVSYHIGNDSGLSRIAIVIVSVSIIDTHEEIRYRLACEHGVKVTQINSVFPTLYKSGDVIVIRSGE